MWTKVNKKLEELMCDSLKGRVRYFKTSYRHAHDGTGRGSIVVDSKEVINACALKYQVQSYRKGMELKNNPDYTPKYNSEWSYIHEGDEIAHSYGLRSESDFHFAIKKYLEQSIEESINSNDYLIRIFALIDRRLGKRMLIKLADKYDEMFEIEKFFYDLRCEAEKLHKYKMKKIHQYCSNNKKVLDSNIKCGCFHCCEIFNSKEINEWIDEGKTALCPHCSIDSVLPESNQYELNKVMLKEMYEYWFE